MKCRIRGHISVGVNATLEVISVVWISEPLLANRRTPRGGLALQQLSGLLSTASGTRWVDGQEAEDASAPPTSCPRETGRATRARDQLLSVTCVDRGQRSK